MFDKQAYRNYNGKVARDMFQKGNWLLWIVDRRIRRKKKTNESAYLHFTHSKRLTGLIVSRLWQCRSCRAVKERGDEHDSNF